MTTKIKADVAATEASEAAAAREPYVSVPRQAVEWLASHYPALCEKSELCERIGHRLYVRTAIAAPAQGARLQTSLEGLREKLLTPRETMRDADGWLYHPDIPVLDEGSHIRKFLEAFFIESKFVSMESDDSAFYDRWCEEGLSDCSPWTVTPPVGDGWLLLEIYETEDGPYALFGRDWYAAERARKKAARQARRTEGLATSSQTRLSDAINAEKELAQCAAGKDGDCSHPACPQLRDSEPLTTGRHCPLDTWSDND